MGDISDQRREKVLKEIHRLRKERSRESVKAAIVADNLQNTPKEVAPVLRKLSEDGLLDSWGSSTPTTYIIEFTPEDVSVDLSDVASD